MSNSNAFENAYALHNFSPTTDPGNGGGFWLDDSTPGVNIHLRDRVFIGAGAQYTGNKNAPLGGSWLTTLVANYFEKNTQMSVLSQNGKIGFVGATSLTTGETTGVAIGVAGVSYCNLAGGTARGGYFDVTHNTGVASYGVEIETSNQGTDVTANSYSASSGVYGLKASPGSGVGYVLGDTNTAAPQAVAPSAAALLIQAGPGAALPQQWRTGIIFNSNALAGDDGTTGTAEAISFGKGHAANWYASSAILAATIRSDVTAVANQDVAVIFTNNTISLNSTASAGSVPMLQLTRDTAGAGGVNYVTLANARTNTNPTFSAVGSDTNVGVVWQSKGTGLIQLKTNGGEVFRVSGAVATPVNFVQIAGQVAASSPRFSALGSDTDIDIELAGKGAKGIKLIDGAIATKFQVNTTGIGFFAATPAAQSTGWGTPTGNVKTSSFPGATATLVQTSQQLAQLLLDLKSYGILGA